MVLSWPSMQLAAAQSSYVEERSMLRGVMGVDQVLYSLISLRLMSTKSESVSAPGNGFSMIEHSDPPGQGRSHRQRNLVT